MSAASATIRILPAQLANQIAAGEVVERPASVVKELVENSLDSGANQIDIEIDKGGHKRICIRDNGVGIEKDQLALALSRHATSKISTLDDLEQIHSLGFRGEALASISSVARLTLTSKPKAQQQAWQAYAEGRDMQVQLNPVAHPDGSSVEVIDLFFNTPARRKFLRAEKTEFTHIDEMIRRISLSRFDVSFSLKHNGKLLRKYPALTSQTDHTRRLSAICNKDFASTAIALDSQYQDFQLSGWVSPPDAPHGQSDVQYFYVNGRMMRDKLINHAIRQAFEGVINPDTTPNYVLYLQLPHDEVDVNVHPAKHEVRFHQARVVHDFIFRAITQGIDQYFSGSAKHDEPNKLQDVEPQHDYIRPLQTIHSHSSSEPSTAPASAAQGQSRAINEGLPPQQGYSSTSSGPNSSHAPNAKGSLSAQAIKGYQQLMKPATELVTDVTQAPQHASFYLPVDEDRLLVMHQERHYVLPLTALIAAQLQSCFDTQNAVAQPLLMPVALSADNEILQRAQAMYEVLLSLSVDIGWNQKRVILRKVPAGMRSLPWANILATLLEAPHNTKDERDDAEVKAHLFHAIALHSAKPTPLQAQQWWSEHSTCPQTLTTLINNAKAIPLAELLSTYVEHHT